LLQNNQSTGAFDFAASSSLMRGCKHLNALFFSCLNWRDCFQSDSWKDLPHPSRFGIQQDTQSVFAFIKGVLQKEILIHRGSLFRKDCVSIDLSGCGLSDDELIPFLQVFKEGKFVNLQELDLVTLCLR
jgi:hypothetical protein